MNATAVDLEEFTRFNVILDLGFDEKEKQAICAFGMCDCPLMFQQMYASQPHGYESYMHHFWSQRDMHHTALLYLELLPASQAIENEAILNTRLSILTQSDCVRIWVLCLLRNLKHLDSVKTYGNAAEIYRHCLTEIDFLGKEIFETNAQDNPRKKRR